jgi:hypothetical protein
MALNFPSSPTSGQTYTEASKTWEWDGSGWRVFAPLIAISNGDKGDITVSSSGNLWVIDNDAVTYAKIQNVSAYYV